MVGHEARTADATVVDYTIDALREAIRSGRLAPGQRLVVADVTAMLAVSAGPVREAIRRLTGEGLIEIVPHRGASVKQITIRDIQEVFELRQAVEGLAARLAAQHARATAPSAELQALMIDMDRLAHDENIEGYLANNTAFHDLIYRLAGNERVRVLAAQLILPIYQLRLPQRMDLDALHLSHADHRVIAAALLAGNGDAAEVAMRRHIAHAGQGLQATVEAMTPPARQRKRERA